MQTSNHFQCGLLLVVILFITELVAFIKLLAFGLLMLEAAYQVQTVTSCPAVVCHFHSHKN